MTTSGLTDLVISYPHGMENGTQDEHINNLRRRRNHLLATTQNPLLESRRSLPNVVSYTEWKIVEQPLSLPQTLCLSISSSSQSKQTSRLLTLPNENLLTVYSYLDADSKAAFSFTCHSLLATAALYLWPVWVSCSQLINILTPSEYHSRQCAGCRRMRPIQFAYWNQHPYDNLDVGAIYEWLDKVWNHDDNPMRYIISKGDAIIDTDAMVQKLALSWTTQSIEETSTNSEGETWSFRTLQHQRQNVLERRFCPTCTAQLLCEDIKLQVTIDRDAIYQSLQRAAAGTPVCSWDSRTVSLLLSFEMVFGSIAENLSVVRSDMNELNTVTERLVTKVDGLGSDAREVVSDVKELSSDAKELAADSKDLSGQWAGLKGEAEAWEAA